jgi:hypothetical protein
MSLIKRYQQAADRFLDGLPDFRSDAPRRTPLTASQHILHLLLSIVTCGLWLPIWFIRAWRGNPATPAAEARERQ